MRLDLDPAADAVGSANIADLHQVFRQGVGIQERRGQFACLLRLALGLNQRSVQRPGGALLSFSHVCNKNAPGRP
ncbi:hypothetical protein D3C72_1550310 [compost metagenome]